MQSTSNQPGAPVQPAYDLLKPEAVAALDEVDGRKKKKKKDKEKGRGMLGSDRGIETMFRTSYMTHVNLSGLADSKANIMISINGLIMSIVIASISPKMDANQWLLIPTSVLLLGCLGSMIYAILAARPRVTSRIVNLDELRQNRANILFFGNFVHLPEEDFVQGMTDLMQNTDGLYYNMIRDLYGLGQVLEQKFRLLRVSYTIFMGALATGVVLFVIVYVGIVLFAPVPAPTTTPMMP